jgi:hypothetical protein
MRALHISRRLDLGRRWDRWFRYIAPATTLEMSLARHRAGSIDESQARYLCGGAAARLRVVGDPGTVGATRQWLTALSSIKHGTDRRDVR